jgi:hypothetical protein
VPSFINGHDCQILLLLHPATKCLLPTLVRVVPSLQVLGSIRGVSAPKQGVIEPEDSLGVPRSRTGSSVSCYMTVG